MSVAQALSAVPQTLTWPVTIVLLLVVLKVVLHFVRALFPKSVKDNVVLITGAGSGIGQLLAYEFTRLGSKVVLWDINEKGLKVTEAEVAKRGGQATIHVVDVTSPDQVYKAAAAVLRSVGKVDILINNAGVVSGREVTDLEDRSVQLTFNVNVVSHIYILKALLPDMYKRNSGHIVTVASMAGLNGSAKLVDYCASKFAAVGLHDALRCELRRKNAHIDTTLICPFYIKTGMFTGVTSRRQLFLPLLEPDYVARRIVQGIRCNEERVIMPALGRLFPFLKSFTPMWLQTAVMDWLGANESMDHFTGRKEA